MSQESKRQRAERAAAAIKERERKERRRQFLIVAGVLAALLLVVGGLFVFNMSRDDTDEVAAAAPAAGSEFGLTIGEDSAPHKVVVYEDFLCPFCGEFEAASHEELAALADDGSVQVEYRPYDNLSNLGDYSADAAAAFKSVVEKSPDAALDFHNALFSDQPSEGGPFPSRDDLAEVMTDAGADDAAVQYFTDGEADAWVEDATQSAQDTGIEGTPTVILDGKAFTDGRTVDELAANLLTAVQ